ncbi:hypothetical protein G6F61_011361 [Rhizopus arrhizus]|nr:hypothetical protein G6F42_018012 [Rhizopus arrhizus]KAG1372085.1 hypothetical protein G6F61_011361 [Rhizopus arrhizus]
MSSSSSISTSHYLFVQRSAPEYANGPLVNVQFAVEMEFDTHVNKRNAATVPYMPEEALKACLLLKEMRYFICDHEGLPSGEASESNEQHASSDPLATPDVTSSRLSNAIKNWIHQQVDSNKDWRAIKATLPLSEQRLDTLSHVKVAGATHESVRARDTIRASINKMMQAENVEIYESYVEHFNVSFSDSFPAFGAYFEKMWLGRKNLWSKRDGLFLNKRVDRVIYTLRVSLTSEQSKKKKKGDEIELSIAQSEYLERCTCPDMTYLYKYIFLGSRKHAIPYSDKAVFFRCQQSKSVKGPINDSDDIINKVVSDYQAIIEEQERQNLLRVNVLSESLRQEYSVLGS